MTLLCWEDTLLYRNSLYTIAISYNREKLMEKMKSLIAGFDEEEEERKLALILDLACTKGSIERSVEKSMESKIWIKQVWT